MKIFNKVNFTILLLCLTIKIHGANPAMEISPAFRSYKIRSDAVVVIPYTITNHTNRTIQQLNIDILSGNEHRKNISLIDNQCVSGIAPGAICTFTIMLNKIKQDIKLQPKACAFNHTVCAIAKTVDIAHVTVTTVNHQPRLYANLFSGPADAFQAYNLQTRKASGNPISDFSLSGISSGLMVSRDGKRVFQSEEGAARFDIIDVTNKNPRMSKRITVGSRPVGIALNQDETKAYVANFGSDTVSVIDLVKNNVIKTINVGGQPHGIMANHEGTRVYVTNHLDGTLSLINTATNKVIKTFSANGDNPLKLAMSPDGKTYYVTNGGAIQNVTFFNTVDDTVRSEIDVSPVCVRPGGMTISADGRYLYVACFFSSSIIEIDTLLNTVTRSTTVAGPIDVALAPDGKTLYVSNALSNYISKIRVSDFKTTRIQTTLPQCMFGQYVG